MGGWLFDQLIGEVIGFLLTFAVDTLDELWKLLAQTLFTTPNVTALPQVQTISGRSLVIVNTSFVLAIITAGLVLMARETLQVRYGIGELAPRLVVGFIAANFATPICRTIIETANALTLALTGQGITSAGSLDQLRRVIRDAMSNPANKLLIAIIGLFIAVLTAMLLIAWIVRLVVLVVLVGIAPVALACHALPFLDPAARLWWRAMIGVVAVVLLQALALHTSLSIFLDPAANRAALGMPGAASGTFNLFLVACLLWVTVRIPGLVRRYVTTGGQRHNIGGYIFRLVVVQQLTRGLAGRIRGIGGTTRTPAAGVGGAGRGPTGAAGMTAGTGMAGGMPGRASGPFRSPRLSRPTPGRTVPGAAGTSPAAPASPPAAGASARPSGTGWPQRPASGRVPPPGAQPSGTGWPERPTTRQPPPAGAQPSGTG
jgi:hypothetical protein